jgi:ComF family protein
MTLLHTAGRMALDLLYPPHCAVCGTNGSLLCDACLAGLPRAIGERCDVCWKPVHESGRCSCSDGPLAFTKLRSALRYGGEVRRLILAFKFAGQSSLTECLTRPLLQTYKTHGLSAGVIVPVPMTGLGRRLRGYNQAALLANELSKLTGVPYAEALSRLRSVREQARSATAEERRRNVVGAFAVRRVGDVAGKTVVLIDDVATTGATLDACARELLAAGAASVSALTLARED